MAPKSKKINLLLVLSSLVIFLFFFGQLARIQTNFFERSVPFMNFGVLALSLLNLFSFKIKNKKEINLFLLSFLIYSTIRSLFSQPGNLSLAYLMRLNLFLLLFTFPSKKLNQNRKKIQNLFLLVIFANAIFGLVQYFFWPNFTYFSSQGWDPHLHRLVSTFFDPTFTALIYILGLQLTYTSNLKKTLKNLLYLVLFVALALTYSRAGLIVFIFLVFLNNKKLTHLALILTTFTILVLPRPFGEGTKLERTSTIRARIQNYQEGIVLSSKNPLFGIGYNNLPILRNEKSHSSSGFDSSLLTILSTNGLVGLALFLLGIKKHLQKTNPTNRNLFLLTLLHSFSANSLLYSWVLLVLTLT